MSKFSAFILAAMTACSSAMAAGPSFSCAGSLNATERVICADAGLSTIDANIDKNYQALMKTANARERRSYQLSQRAFIKYRNSCGADFQCIRLAYRGQGQELRSASTKVDLVCPANGPCYHNHDAR